MSNIVLTNVNQTVNIWNTLDIVVCIIGVIAVALLMYLKFKK